jgi:hypothetical protein
LHSSGPLGLYGSDMLNVRDDLLQELGFTDVEPGAVVAEVDVVGIFLAFSRCLAR